MAIAKTYDGAHLRAIHRHLFQDVYAWAGECALHAGRTLRPWWRGRSDEQRRALRAGVLS